MTTGLNFWDISIWTFILCLTAIFVAMLLANLLIKTIKPLRKALIPSPVLGGFLLLAFLAIYKAIAGEALFQGSILEIITYHALGLGFVASALKVTNKPKEKGSQKAIFNASLITVSGYTMQAIVGLIISMLLFVILNGENWPAAGLLLPMGFGQGPGQAFNWGNIFSQYTSDQAYALANGLTYSTFGAFTNGGSFGLSIAAMGFISASVGGVIYLNIQRKKGNAKMINRTENFDEKLSLEDYQQENEISSSDSIDKSSVQVGIVFLVYAISFAFIYGISRICDASGVSFLLNTIKPLFWGFNFIFGTAFAALWKLLFKGLHKKGIVKKQYTNNYMLDRVSGIAFDVMVVSAISAIDLSAFGNREFIIPLILMCLFGAVTTYFYVQHVSKVLYPQYSDEAFLAMYGMLTGAASTGVILLREIDPQFKTPACCNMVFQALYSIVLGAPILLAMGSSTSGWTSLFIWFTIFIVYFIFIYLLIRREDIAKKIKSKKVKQ
ncbi:MAG: hypothetical protein H6687_02500 [Bacillales bacterium]|nr:hypothetical protein [Bacillales bacterium]